MLTDWLLTVQGRLAEVFSLRKPVFLSFAREWRDWDSKIHSLAKACALTPRMKEGKKIGRTTKHVMAPLHPVPAPGRGQCWARWSRGHLSAGRWYLLLHLSLY